MDDEQTLYFDPYQDGYRRGLREGKRNGLTAAIGWELLFGALCLGIGYMCGRGIV